jgi:hypothetical protein
MQGEQNFFVFWLTNFGAFLPLVGWLLWRLARQRGPQSAALLVLPSVAVFVICGFVKFAPWEWDNTKLMLWSYLVLLPPLWEVLLARFPEWGRALSCFLLFFSGAVSLFGGLFGGLVTNSEDDRVSSGQPTIGYSVAARAELDGARWATRNLPSTDRFIGYPYYNHPLLLSGRLMVMGYEGHLWSHGIDFEARKEAVERVLKGEPGWRETAARLGARWLFWGEQERAHYPDSPKPWRTECRLQADGAWGALYDLEGKK